MTEKWNHRTAMMLGNEGVEKLEKSHVIIFGIGGVGGYIAEGLARSGVGRMTLVDRDVVSITNINRQIIADMSTVGRYKTEVMRERILRINPCADVTVRNEFFLPASSPEYRESSEKYDFSQYDYVADAVDTVSAKLEIIVKSREAGTPVISCMGAGNKINPAAFCVADIYDTSVCPLARVMRRECKKRNIDSLKVVYSKEEAYKSGEIDEQSGKTVPGSVIFAPAGAGLLIASEIVRDIIGG